MKEAAKETFDERRARIFRVNQDPGSSAFNKMATEVAIIPDSYRPKIKSGQGVLIRP
jgi:hypothetical protein